MCIISMKDIVIVFRGTKLSHFNGTLNCAFYYILTVVSFVGSINAGNYMCSINV